jgi:hypothetical protein
MKEIMLLGGTVLSMINLLPLPWPLRLLWLRFLYFLTVKGIFLFPSILSFTEEQNTIYKMGKQEGEEYESMVQLEKVLEYVDSKRISINCVQEAIDRAEAETIPPEQLGAFIARTTLDLPTAEQVLKASLRSTRY